MERAASLVSAFRARSDSSTRRRLRRPAGLAVRPRPRRADDGLAAGATARRSRPTCARRPPDLPRPHRPRAQTTRSSSSASSTSTPTRSSRNEPRPAPPSGWPPPAEARRSTARAIELEPLAAEVADRYFGDYPEDLERYGDAGRAWEIHDTQHLLEWAIGDVEGYVELERAGRLAGPCARGARLPARASGREPRARRRRCRGAGGGRVAVADKLRGAAATVRAH